MRILKSHPLISLANRYLLGSSQKSFTWNFSSLISTLFITEVIIGVTLAMHYNSSVLKGFLSIEHVLTDRNLLVPFFLVNFFFIFPFWVYYVLAKPQYIRYRGPLTSIELVAMLVLLSIMVAVFLAYNLPYGRLSVSCAKATLHLYSLIYLSFQNPFWNRLCLSMLLVLVTSYIRSLYEKESTVQVYLRILMPLLFVVITLVFYILFPHVFLDVSFAATASYSTMQINTWKNCFKTAMTAVALENPNSGITYQQILGATIHFYSNGNEVFNHMVETRLNQTFPSLGPGSTAFTSDGQGNVTNVTSSCQQLLA